MTELSLWFLFAYAVGTGFGYVIGKISSVRQSAELTIDTLIEGGYLRYRKNSNGDIELLKINEE